MATVAATLDLETKTSANKGESRATILIVEDSPLYRRLVEQSLAGSGCTVLCATNGRDALELFKQHEPEIVITDWMMPDVSGVELCQRIRRDFEHLYPYLILLSGNTQKEEVIEGFAAGADDYLTKPFHDGELQARVRVGLRIIQLHRQIQTKNKQLEELALTDCLTGLPNRRAIENWAKRELSAAQRHGFSVWAVLADLDHFKKINDAFGHDAGDMVLRRVAEVISSNTREYNVSGRYGGEEFVVMLTHVTREQANAAIERIRIALEQQSFTADGKVFGVTASFGIAGTKDVQKFSLRQLLKEADAALYLAKSHGRNRIEFA
jgi:two-component system, cell cycle response regulator